MSTNGAYDVGRIRADFPILATQVYGKPLVYLDNAASAQKPKAVLDRLQQAYTRNTPTCIAVCTISPTRRPRPTRARAERSRRSSTPARSEEIIFTRNATEAINLVAYTFGRERIKPGDEIVLSIMEHHSNIVPWHFLRERQGAVIKWAPVDDDGNFLIDEFEKLIGPRTKMVAITHMSNMLGTLVPIKEVTRIAHAHGVPVLIDGAQGAVHRDVDVRDIDCDFYVLTGHKLYGPTGIGALYGKYRHLEAMPPFNGGGEMIREVFQDRITYGEPPYKFEAGTPSIVQAIGLGAALDYIGAVGKPRIRAHEAGLTELCPGPIARDQLAAHLRHHQGQGADRLVRDEGRPSPRRGDHHRSLRRRDPRRHPLRDAAIDAVRAPGELPRVVCHVQHPRGGGHARAGADQSSGILRMTDETKPPAAATTLSPPRKTSRRSPATASRRRRPRLPGSAIPADETGAFDRRDRRPR